MTTTRRSGPAPSPESYAWPRTRLADGLLSVRFDGDQRLLSWAPYRGGAQVGRSVTWVGVRDAELSEHVDPVALLAGRLAAAGCAGSVGPARTSPGSGMRDPGTPHA